MEQAPTPVPVELINIMFSGQNVNQMLSVMESPMRRIMDIKLKQLETIGTAIIASEGKPDQLMAALTYGFFSHLDDPIREAQILIQGAIFHDKLRPK